MFQIARANTIIHPRTMMIHATNAAIANATMMTAGGFKGLTLSTHGMRIFNHALTFRGNGGDGDTAGIRQARLDMRGQGQGNQCRINHAQEYRNTLC